MIGILYYYIRSLCSALLTDRHNKIRNHKNPMNKTILLSKVILFPSAWISDVPQQIFTGFFSHNLLFFSLSESCWPREAAVGDKLVAKCWLCECPSMGPDSPAVKSATNRLEEPRTEFPGTLPRSCWWQSHWRIYDTRYNRTRHLRKTGGNKEGSLKIGDILGVSSNLTWRNC